MSKAIWVSLCCSANGYVDYFNVFLRLLLVHPGILDFVNNVKSLKSPSKYGVLPVQPRRLLGSDEELGAVGVWTSVGHADGVGLVMLQGRKFVLEFLAPNTLSTCPIT